MEHAYGTAGGETRARRGDASDASDAGKQTATRSFQWIYYLVASFYFGAVFLRSILIYQGRSELPGVAGLLFAWLALFVSEPRITRRWSAYFPIYLLIQTILVFILLSTPADFFAALFAMLSMQVMFHLDPKIGSAWILVCALGMVLLLTSVYKAQTIALVLLYTAGNVFYGAYSRAAHRAQEMQSKNQTLAQKLEQANQRLHAYSAQLEQLASARERNRLARDLHDSVTQTVFSMALTTQSAALLLKRDPDRVEPQLERLSRLAQSALAEMQLLIAELRPAEITRGGLASRLRQYLAEGRFSDNLSLSLDVQGEGSLGTAEQQGLFHIVQEALNNVVKHAHASRAQIRLHLSEPMWVEIEDWGRGFNVQQAQRGERLGLLGMRERAAEIGWDLQIKAAPGAGTCIRVEKLSRETR